MRVRAVLQHTQTVLAVLAGVEVMILLSGKTHAS